MDQNNQAWRVKTVRGDTFTVRTVLAIKPTSCDGRWVAQVIVPEVTSYGASPRESVLRLALRLGWDLVEIAAPGERLASEGSEAVGAVLKLSLAHVAAAIRADNASHLASNLHYEVKSTRASSEKMIAAIDADRDAEQAYERRDDAEVDLHAAICGEIGGELIDSAFGALVMEIRSLLEDEP